MPDAKPGVLFLCTPPFYPEKRYENWELAGLDIDAVRQIRDDVQNRYANS
jgi:hypothetical protein